MSLVGSYNEPYESLLGQCKLPAARAKVAPRVKMII